MLVVPDDVFTGLEVVKSLLEKGDYDTAMALLRCVLEVIVSIKSDILLSR